MTPWRKYILYALGAVVFFLIFLVVLIPGEFVEGVLRNSLKEHTGAVFTAVSFKKSFPLAFRAEKVRLKAEGIKAVELESVSGSVAILPLILGEALVTYDIRLGGGALKGNASLEGAAARVSFDAQAVALKALTPLVAFGIKGAGSFSGDGAVSIDGSECPEGHVDMEIKGVDISGLDSPYPAMLFGDTLNLGFALEAAGCVASVKGLWIEGDELNAKINGTIEVKNPIEASLLDLTAELFPDNGSTEPPGVLAFLKEYKLSSGFYSMKLRGTIERPVVER